jgi:hypothetical protein
MDLIEQYLSRSREIIGNRTQAEIRYDNEVLRWLRRGKNIEKAIDTANKKYPEEALKTDDSNIDNVVAHYDYLMQHDEIMRKLSD